MSITDKQYYLFGEDYKTFTEFENDEVLAHRLFTTETGP